MIDQPTAATWSAITITAANPKQAQLFKQELLLRQRRGWIHPDTLLLAVPDPSSARIGSGGATINALIATAEHLSARAGYSVIDAEVLQSSRILIFHSGGDSRRIPLYSVCGKAFSSLPLLDSEGDLLAPIDLLLYTLSQTASQSPSGLFVASSDVILDLQDCQLDWSKPGVTGLAIPVELSYGSKHGVYKSSNDRGRVETFIQKGSEEELYTHQAVLPDRKVLVDTGVVFFDTKTVEILLNFHVHPPLDACTYLGVDNGAVPLRLELYSDLLICMAQKSEYPEYMQMSTADLHPERIRRARELIWKAFREQPFWVNIAVQGQFIHLGTVQEYKSFLEAKSLTMDSFHWQKLAKSYSEQAEVLEESIAINSYIAGTGQIEGPAVIEHSELRGRWRLGRNSICSGIRSCPGIQIEEGLVVQEINLEKSPAGRRQWVVTVYGINDPINESILKESSTFVHRSWPSFFQEMDLTPEEIWPGVIPEERKLWNAKLYPILKENDYPEITLWLQYDKKPSEAVLRQWRRATRVALSDILNQASPVDELIWKQNLALAIDLAEMENVLLERQDRCLLPMIQRWARENRVEMLSALDEMAAPASPQVQMRIFACMADTLASLAGSRVGLRSGPTRNPLWQRAYDLLYQGQTTEAIAELASLRQDWIESPEFLMRSARHYEGAAQVLVRKSVETSEVRSTEIEPSDLNQWVLVEAPARVDLAGGWSDTPPITYELGGTVVNMAITVDGKRPIAARCRRIPEACITISVPGSEQPIYCRTLVDLADYTQPLAPGALVKAAIVSMGIVSISSSSSLEEQLERWGGGLEIQTQTSLPVGSGMGTSSILAGTLMAAIGKAVGIGYDNQSLVHLVLHLEQILTTGGGWQDQVGGLLPGIKVANSPASLPLRVEWELLDLPTDFLSHLQDHLLLIYTGRVRLARNLLQDVIRRWHARLPEVMDITRDLVDNAQRMKKALLHEDIESIGRCLSAYWDQKKRIAGGAEPAHVARMISLLQPLTHGISLTGAGGGGFLIAATKEPIPVESIRSLLHPLQEDFPYSIHSVAIDKKGMQIGI